MAMRVLRIRQCRRFTSFFPKPSRSHARIICRPAAKLTSLESCPSFLGARSPNYDVCQGCAMTVATTTPASGPGPLAGPASKGNTSILPWCHVVNGTDSPNSASFRHGVSRPALFNSTASCVQPSSTPTTTPCTSLIPTSCSYSRGSHHASNISGTKSTKTCAVSTTSSPHPTSHRSSGVLLPSTTCIVPVTPSSRVVISSGPPATPECPPPTHAKSSLSPASFMTSSSSAVVKHHSPSSPVSAPAHTTTCLSGSSPTASGVPEFPNTEPPMRPSVPSSSSITVPKRPISVWPSESSPTTSRAAKLPNTVPPSSPAVPSSPPVPVSKRPSSVWPSDSSSTASGAPKFPNSASPTIPAVPSSASVTVSKKPPPVTPSSPASVTGFSSSPGRAESTRSTITSTLTETPETTFSTPVSITETTDGHVTITAPPIITTTGPSTLPNGTVVTVTHVIANPPDQGAFSSPGRNSFFGNHAAVVGVFLATGFILAGLLLLLFCCFRRRRQRQTQRRGTRLPEISHPQPIQDPFANVTGSPAVHERAGPNVRWHGFMQPRGLVSTNASSISVPLNRSDENLPRAYSGPVPPPPAQRAPSRSSYRIPVPYAGVGAYGNDIEHPQSTSTPGEHPQTQTALPSNAPPLPMRSPLRLLAAHNAAKIPRENALRLSLSRASSPSIYPPSQHPSDAESLHERQEVVASLPSSSLKRETSGWLTRGLSFGNKSDSGQGHKVVDRNAESQGAQISPVDFDGTRSVTLSASSSSHAHHSSLESPTSDTGTTLTSIQDGNAYNRKFAPPRAPIAPLFIHQVENRKSGARLRESTP